MDTNNKSLPEDPVIIMIETSHSGNIGSAARAMKTMQLKNLRLVKPKCDHLNDQANAMSSGANTIIKNASVHSSFYDAIKDIDLVVALSHRSRSIPLPTYHCREFLTNEYRNQKVAFVFGNEQNGISNEDMDLCHIQMYIPTDPHYPSLNVASSIQIVCYEWLMYRQNFKSRYEVKEPPATVEETIHLHNHCKKTFKTMGIIRNENPEHILRRIVRMVNRIKMTRVEVALCRGILSAIDKAVS